MRSVFFPAWRALATVDTAALGQNYHLLLTQAQKINPNAQLMAVVKANAYGHGAARVVSALLERGCRRFAVATLQEA